MFLLTFYKGTITVYLFKDKKALKNFGLRLSVQKSLFVIQWCIMFFFTQTLYLKLSIAIFYWFIYFIFSKILHKN